jgi:selenocysteine lyase/cysteine desulfurase
MPQYLPDRFEAGTMNTPAAAGLCEGIRWVRSLGEGAAHYAESIAWEAATSFMWDDKRFIIYDDTPGSVLLFNVLGIDSSDVAAALNDHRVYVRSGLHCAPLAHDTIGTKGGAVRASFGAMSTKRDGFRFWRILSDIADELI